jgi:hypothetical protein
LAADGTPPPISPFTVSTDVIVFSSPSFVVGVIFLFIILQGSEDMR